MRFLNFSTLHPFAQLLFLVFVSIASLMLTVAVSTLIAIPLFGISFETLGQTSENIAYLKYSQAMQSVGLFIVPALVAAYIFSETDTKQIRNYLQIRRPENSRNIMFVFLIPLAAMPIISFTGKLNAGIQLPESLHALELSMQALEETAKKIVEKFLITNSYSALFVNILIIAILPAIGEELFFRGTVQRILLRWTSNPHVGIFLASAIFSFIHFQFYGFIPRLLLGMVFGYLFFWSKNIWYPIIAHFINNAVAVILYFFYNDLQGTPFADEFDSTAHAIDNSVLMFAAVSLSALIALLYTFYKTQKNKQNDNLLQEK